MSKAQISRLELTTYQSYVKGTNLSPWINNLPKLYQKWKPLASDSQPTKVISKAQISPLLLTTYQSLSKGKNSRLEWTTCQCYIKSENLSPWIDYLPKLYQKRKPLALNYLPTKIISKVKTSRHEITTYQSIIKSENLLPRINYLPKFYQKRKPLAFY